MINELPKLFGKSFAIGFFLPASMLSLGMAFTLDIYGINFSFKNTSTLELLDVAVSVFIIWLISILLMALNRSIVRFLEGYVPSSVWRAQKLHMETKFSKDIEPLLETMKAIDKARASGQNDPPRSPDFPQLLRKAISHFPHERRFVLPTKFGNIIRSFEAYSIVVYGLDAIPAWPRLMMIIPDGIRNQVEEGRSSMDFSVNFFISTVIILFTYVSCALYHTDFLFPIIPFVCVVLSILAWFVMQAAALQWGELVKSVFDLYRNDLADRLGLDLPDSPALERQMWQIVNRTMIYRSAAGTMELEPFRKKTAKPTKPSSSYFL